MSGALPFALHKVIYEIGLEPTWPWGYANLIFGSLLSAWFLADTFFPRREIYGFFGLSEGTLKHSLRFWRRVGLLASTIVGLGFALIAFTNPETSSTTLNKDTAGPTAILAGAFLASFGWMYTRFEQEKADRAVATLQAIRDQMYGGHISKIYQYLTVLSKHCVDQLNTPPERPFNEKELSLPTATVIQDIKMVLPGLTSHANVADQFINSLNQLAFGVRQGQFDLDTIILVLRPRFVRIAFRYHELIRQTTRAKHDVVHNRYRAEKRTWEHFLWLTSKMDILTTDNVEYSWIIMPPDHIIGTGKGERVDAPNKIKLPEMSRLRLRDRIGFWVVKALF